MVVILVNKPATISIISVTGIELISYWRPVAPGKREPAWPGTPDVADGANISSLAKLWICERSRTFMRLGEAVCDGSKDWDAVEVVVKGDRGADEDATLKREDSSLFSLCCWCELE